MASVYCTRTDLANYLSPSALESIDNATQDAACVAASSRADGYLRGRYALPLSAWGQDLTEMTAYIACYLLMSSRGYAPSGGSDSLIMSRYYEAVGRPDMIGSGWFPGVQRQAIHPDVTPAVAQPGDPVHDLPQVRSQPQRGWPEFSPNGTPSVS